LTATAQREDRSSPIRKFLSALVVVPLGIILIVFAIANRHVISVSFDPFGSDAPSLTANMPLFMVILLSVIVGVLCGGIATWFGQGKWRRYARRADADARNLRIERDALRMELEAARKPTPTMLPPAA
jgi:uncharacterized integral membrane protein